MNDSRGRPRVAVTGVGIVSALGIGSQSNLAAARSATTGIRAIARFDASSFNCKVAGEVIDVDKLREGNLDLFSSFALAASTEAANGAGLSNGFREPERVGVIVGTGLGGCETLDSSYLRFYGERNSRLAPLTIPRSMYNAASSAVATRLGAKGPSMTTVAACSSGANAIGEAAIWIRAGVADTVIAGGSDAPLTPGIVRAWEALRVLSSEKHEAERACRPFSLDRTGLVLSEGAAVVILESFDSAIGRNAQILGEIAGFGATSDAAHLTDPQIDGPARAMRAALADSGLTAVDVDYVNAHGTGTRMNDKIETAAIKLVFGEHAGRLAVSSTKSLHGHAMGASGAIELVLTILCANEGFIPPTANLRVPDPECDLDYVPDAARPGRINVAISNSLAFGGMNSVLVLKSKNRVLEEDSL